MVWLIDKTLHASIALRPSTSRRGDDGTLVRREREDGGRHLGQGLPRKQAVVRPDSPTGGRSRPVPVAPKPPRVDGRLPAEQVVVERRRGRPAGVPVPALPDAVQQDPEDPRLQRGPALEASQPLQDPDPGLLHDLLSRRWIPEVGQSHLEQGGLVAIDQLHEDPFVAPSQRLHQPRVACDIKHARCGF